MSLVLDAGALIAVERRDRQTSALVEAARAGGRTVVVPAGVIGQVWRSGARQALVSRLLGTSGVTIEPLTDERARAAGLLCGRAGTADVIDASVVLAARAHRATVVSSDRADLSALDAGLAIIDC